MKLAAPCCGQLAARDQAHRVDHISWSERSCRASRPRTAQPISAGTLLEQRINEQQHPVPDALDADEVLEADAI